MGGRVKPYLSDPGHDGPVDNGVQLVRGRIDDQGLQKIVPVVPAQLQQRFPSVFVPVVRKNPVGCEGGSGAYCPQSVFCVSQPFPDVCPQSRVECSVADIFQPAFIWSDVEPVPEYRYSAANCLQVRAVGILQPLVQFADVCGAVVLGLVLDLVVSEDVPLEIIVGK